MLLLLLMMLAHLMTFDQDFSKPYSCTCNYFNDVSFPEIPRRAVIIYCYFDHYWGAFLFGHLIPNNVDKMKLKMKMLFEKFSFMKLQETDRQVFFQVIFRKQQSEKLTLQFFPIFYFFNRTKHNQRFC